MDLPQILAFDEAQGSLVGCPFTSQNPPTKRFLPTGVCLQPAAIAVVAVLQGKAKPVEVPVASARAPAGVTTTRVI